MDAEGYGRVTAQFSVRDHTVSGYIACDSEEGTRRLQEREQTLREAILAGADTAVEPLRAGDIGIVYSREVHVKDFAGEEQTQDTQIETANLYRLARAFITSVAA